MGVDPALNTLGALSVVGEEIVVLDLLVVVMFDSFTTVSTGLWSVTSTSLRVIDGVVIVVSVVSVVIVVIFDDVVVIVAIVTKSEPASVLSWSFLLGSSPPSSSSSSISSSIFPLLLSCMDSTLLAAPLADSKLMVLPSRISISPALSALILSMISFLNLMRNAVFSRSASGPKISSGICSK